MPERPLTLCASLRDAIIAADEDYLIGLSNKGTFNRAKKDLAALAGNITAEEQGESVEVQCGDAKCNICAPLGESKCSCPSNVMCRHRITAILWLKEQTDISLPQQSAQADYAEEATPAGTGGVGADVDSSGSKHTAAADADDAVTADATATATEAGAATDAVATTAADDATAIGTDAGAATDAATADATATGTEAGAATDAADVDDATATATKAGTATADAATATQKTPQKARFSSLLAYPAEALCRQLGAKKTTAIYFRVRTDGIPAFSETSVVTMELPWIPTTVHLLEPLEHSTCSCHRADICDHKAEALLYFQLAHHVITPELLAPAESDRAAPDAGQAAGICLAVRQALAGQLVTGLSRSSPSLCDTLERMAALCHVSRLPAMEKQLRALGGEYSAYFRRSATFSDAALLQRLSNCYLLALRIENAETPQQILALAGRFRTEYRPIGTLHLYALARRDFFGRSGFSGTSYYFWECEQDRFFTYTVARPTYYDDTVRRTTRREEQQAPWGLNCSMEQLLGMTLTLTQAHATAAGRLSASSESRASLHDQMSLGSILPDEAVYRDFDRLLNDKADATLSETQRIACVKAERCVVPDYDEVRQVFSLVLYDEHGRDLFVEVHYRKEEKQMVRALENLAARLKRLPSEVPVFFGSVYLENARLKLYPIEYFTDWRLK